MLNTLLELSHLTSTKPYEAASTVIPISQMKKLRLTQAKLLSHKLVSIGI